MGKKLQHGFPETNKMMEKINRDILGMFKDHVEWEKYEKSVVYPFWNNMKNSTTDDGEFEKWSAQMKKELMKRGATPTVKPQVDFDTSGKVVTKNDFSKLATPNYIVESLEKGLKALQESMEGEYDSEQFNSAVNGILENFRTLTTAPCIEGDGEDVDEAIAGLEEFETYTHRDITPSGNEMFLVESEHGLVGVTRDARTALELATDCYGNINVYTEASATDKIGFYDYRDVRFRNNYL